MFLCYPPISLAQWNFKAQIIGVLPTNHILKLLIFVASYVETNDSQYIPSSNLVSQIWNDILNGINSEEFFPLKYSYDFIVVGGGSGGSVIASRLSEVKEWDVLLIEAGGDENFLNDIPLSGHYQILTPVNWGYKTEPSDNYCLGMKNKQCAYPRGKVLGGSSVLNFMIYSRGNKQDFDNWAAFGNTGWSYKEVLPYFKKSEDMKIPELKNDSVYHSTEGPLTITYAQYRTRIADAFEEAGLEMKENYVDYNGVTQLGISRLQLTVKNGSRWSATRAFIDPVRTRSNLHIRLRSFVTKIILDENNTAVGVEFVHGSKKYKVKARKEVIIAAGAINTPQLLMLSGIGPENHLKELGIEVAKNLSVGYNFLDHVGFLGLMFIINDTMAIRVDDIFLRHPNRIIEYITYKSGPVSIPLGCEDVAFFNVSNSNVEESKNIIELVFLSVTLVSDPLVRNVFRLSECLYNEVYRPVEHAFGYLILPILQQPKSIGRVLLKNADPYSKPLIFPNYFSHEEDLDKLVSGIKFAIKMSKTEAFKKYASKLHDIPFPTCSHLEFASDEYWKCAIRTLTFSGWHAAGTCKMGPSTDPDAVVDPYLKVYGVKRLRIADASIIPLLPACHTTAVVYMIAEKGADLIKKDWGKDV